MKRSLKKVVGRKPSDFLCPGMVGADLRAARCKPFKGTARPEVGPYRDANQMGGFSHADFKETPR